jgi:hypothetical protein
MEAGRYERLFAGVGEDVTLEVSRLRKRLAAIFPRAAKRWHRRPFKAGHASLNFLHFLAELLPSGGHNCGRTNRPSLSTRIVCPQEVCWLVADEEKKSVWGSRGR